ncbi:glycyl-radical enzyme activating protein [Xylocopilactobacillus apis]|uniref:Radical SAM core domain-containing protein n=1 Tax=Xylocopilactobacillus apis TaxID=2932183 RepID=A0AAU9CZW0_9LACO|nr:glycyl-radical enzyme activating protein [Xylocopilactobacillus apis]BDR55550.1 hypothetical protein KIMC2_01120 [Xylocopilactobacillus apis]
MGEKWKKETITKWYTVDEVVKEVEKDDIFYRSSGGGLTLSGGECLVQADFAANLMHEVKTLGINTAIETTGAVPMREIKKVLPYVDHALFDLKIMAPLQARQVIGDDVRMVKASFEAFLNTPTVEVTPRIPLIPGYTTKPENIRQIAAYVNEIGVKEVHILPFHQYGSQKYKYLGRNYTMEDTPLLTQEEVDNIHDYFESQHITAIVSGLE